MPSQPYLSAKVWGSSATSRVSTSIPASPPKAPVIFASVSTGSTGRTVMGATRMPLIAYCGPVGEVDDPRAERPRLHQLRSPPSYPVLEEAPPAPQDNRVHHEL